MIFNNASKEELNQLLLRWMDNTEEPIFIVDDKFNVVYLNKPFENFTQIKYPKLSGINFGRALGCRYLDKDNQDCGNNYYCEICSIREAIKSNISGRLLESGGNFVRDFNLDDEIVFRHIIFKSFRVQFAGSPYVVVIINQSETDLNHDNIETESV